jgi:hypothetical protein
MTTKQESYNTFNRFLQKFGVEPLAEGELVDWNFQGDETDEQLSEWAHDLASDLRTEKCEAKDAWIYEV